MGGEIFKIIWITIQIVIGFNLFFPIVLLLIYKIKGDHTKSGNVVNPEPDYAIIVTAYEQTYTVPSVVASLLQLDYKNYIIYIVADKCDISNLIFNDQRVVVLRPPETLASNTRSHFYAINRFVRPHQYLTIIDSDNLVEADYLNQLNTYFHQGFEAVQGTRKAKNLNTNIACLDAARDIYYHFYDGKVIFGVGSSATLTGSGMAFTTQLYRDSLEHLDVTGAGFDKVLQYAIVSASKRIAFAENAVVYDEKTSRTDQLVNQRSRWINTWFRYVKFGFKMVYLSVKNFNFNQFIFGIILLRPPLFIFLIISLLCMVVDTVLLSPSALVWAAGFTAFIAGFMIALQHSHTDKRIYQSLIMIPQFILFQVISLLNVRKANKRSVATTHYLNVEIDEVTGDKKKV